MDAKCSSLHKYAPPSWCFLGSVDRVAYLFGLPVDVTGPRGSVTWLRSASAASRRLSRRFFGADAAAWFAGVWCALVCYPGSTTSTTCGCVRLRAVGTGLVLSGCVWLSYGCTGGYSTVFLGYSTVIVRFLRNCPLWPATAATQTRTRSTTRPPAKKQPASPRRKMKRKAITGLGLQESP